jgi:hypothetical protein
MALFLVRHHPLLAIAPEAGRAHGSVKPYDVGGEERGG